MTHIAILGYGVVGHGVAELVVQNSSEIAALGGDALNVKYVLDLKDFSGDPMQSRVVHDFSVILADSSVSCVVELMGGSHPAYEYTVAALRAGKHVVSSNKEVVSRFGGEFLRLAAENGVTYRFEAAVGGGIPVISPLISFIKQNRLSEVRGILNGTSNYILTRMFKFGDSFASALEGAQAKGYAEKDPAADVQGLDAARKICILAAIATGALITPEEIHTEGITAVRPQDVEALERFGFVVKLVARCIVENDEAAHVFVAPFAIRESEPLAGVFGVYNAVEILAEPLGNVMLYGRGAGAGATASAVVGDVVQIMRTGAHYAAPTFDRGSEARSFESFASENYIALPAGSEAAASAVFGAVKFIASADCAFVTEELTESAVSARLAELAARGIAPLSRIRLLK